MAHEHPDQKSELSFPLSIGAAVMGPDNEIFFASQPHSSRRQLLYGCNGKIGVIGSDLKFWGSGVKATKVKDTAALNRAVQHWKANGYKEQLEFHGDSFWETYNTVTRRYTLSLRDIAKGRLSDKQKDLYNKIPGAHAAFSDV